jgi:hypothetical protein
VTTYGIPDPPAASDVVLRGTDGSRWQLATQYGLDMWVQLDVEPGVIAVRSWSRLVFERGALTEERML